MRLITRGDFDGLACAAVISSREKLRELVLTHPQEILDGNVKIAEHDIIANLPYDPRCGMWFDNSLVAAREHRVAQRSEIMAGTASRGGGRPVRGPL